MTAGSVRKSGLVLVTSLFLLLVEGHVLFAQMNVVQQELPGYGTVEFLEQELIVQFREDANRVQDERFKQQYEQRMQVVRELPGSGLTLVRLTDMNVDEALSYFGSHPDVEYVEPNFVFRMIRPVREYPFSDMNLFQHEDGVFPNDEFFDAQWGLFNEGQEFNVGETPVSGTHGVDISAPSAWSLTTGSENVRVAVIDSGVDYEHEDLNGNMILDQLGRYGIDTSPDTNTPDDPMDQNGHGTHVAGIIGAIGNNGFGVSGVNWDVSLIAVRVFDTAGETSTMSLVEGLQYALDSGAVISNHSYGGFAYSQALYEAFSRAGDQGHLIIAAAGNNGANLDQIPIYPASFNLDNVISVAATDPDDQIADFSNTGVNTVDIAAPGVFIGSTWIDDRYIYNNGTSMATPFVTGVAALIKSFHPALSFHDLRERILNRADQVESLEGFVHESRRLNAYDAVRDFIPDDIVDLELVEAGQTFSTVEWTAVGFGGVNGTTHSFDIRLSNAPITEENFDQAGEVDARVLPKFTGARQKLTIGNLEPETEYFLAIKSEDNFDNKSGISNVVEFMTSAAPVKQIFDGSLVDNNEVETTVQSGESVQGSFTISNTGPGVLNVSSAGRFQPVSLLDDTGRDFSYLFSSSRTEGAPAFDWEDISVTGNPVEFSDPVNGFALTNLPFPFPFYNDMKESVYISVNGLLSFQPFSASGTDGENQMIPAQTGPDDLIAVHWSRLELGPEGDVFTYSDPDEDLFIIQWNNLIRSSPNQNTGEIYSFQVILYRGGTIKMQYLTIGEESFSGTVGIEDSEGRNGELFSFNEPVPAEVAVTFLPQQPTWMEIQDLDYSLQTNQVQEVLFTIDAGILTAGEYYTEIVLLDNDLSSNITRIPVYVSVEGETSSIQYIHGAADPSLSQVDLFVNGMLLKHNVEFQSRTSSIDLPAGIPLDFTVISQESNSIDDVISEHEIQLDSEKKYLMVGSGSASGTPGREFDFFIHEYVEEDVSEDRVRVLFFNSVADVPDISLIGFYTDTRPPLVVNGRLEYGKFSGYELIRPIDLEMDVVREAELFDTFGFNIGNFGGETVVTVLTGHTAPLPGEPVITMFSSTEEGERIPSQKLSSPGTMARHIPPVTELEENFPNPFYRTTTVQFSLPEAREVELIIFDILGRPVQTLFEGTLPAGIHNEVFDAQGLSSGVYFFQIRSADETVTKKMVLIK